MSDSQHSNRGAGVVDPQSRSGEDTTVVTNRPPAGDRPAGAGPSPEQQETTQLDRPSVPPGSPAPPWQRGAAGHEPPEQAQGRPQPHEPIAGHNGGQPSGPFGAVVEPPGLGVPPAHLGVGVPPVGPAPMPGPGPAAPGGQRRVPAPSRPTAHPNRPVRDRAVRAPRKASLQIRRFDPWSVLKLSLVLSIAMFLMWLVAVGVLYGVLDGMGVWDKLNGAYSDLASVSDASGSGEPLISAGRVFGVSAIVGAVNIVLFTAFATVAAFVYNVAADLAGGIEVTLSERD